jgi:hypothetical protein
MTQLPQPPTLMIEALRAMIEVAMTYVPHGQQHAARAAMDAIGIGIAYSPRLTQGRLLDGREHNGMPGYD